MGINENKIFVRAKSSSVDLIKLIRSRTGAQLSSIKLALSEENWIEIAKIRGLDHEEQESSLLSFLKSVDDLNVSYELMIDGEIESKDYLLNILNRWRDICEEQSMMQDLELGSPSILTLEIAKRRMSPDIYHKTLSLVVNEWSSIVDTKTLLWAKEQLAKV